MDKASEKSKRRAWDKKHGKGTVAAAAKATALESRTKAKSERPKGYWNKGIQNYDTGKMN